MRIFTVVFFFIIKERQICYFNLRTGNLILNYQYGLDFNQYT